MALLYAAALGNAPIFTGVAYANGSNVFAMTFLRFGLAAIAMWLILILWHTDFRVTKRELIALVILGIGGYWLEGFLYMKAVETLTPGVLLLVFYLHPVMIVLIDYIVFRIRLTAAKGVAIGLAMIGLLCVVGLDFKQIDFKGVIYIFLAAVAFAFYTIGCNLYASHLDDRVTMTYIATSAAFAALLTGILGGGLVPGLMTMNLTAWGGAFGVSMISTIAGMLCFYKALRLIGPSSATIIGMVEVIIGAVMGAIVFGDRITVHQVIGACFIAASVVCLQRRDRDKSFPLDLQ